MKGIAIIVFIGLCGVVYSKPQEKYTTKFDNIDLDGLIKNDRLLGNYIDCMLGKNKCTKDGEELKKNLPEALQTDCIKCSETQRRGSKKIIKHLIENKPEAWNALQNKYDPERTYVTRHAEELKKEGIKV